MQANNNAIVQILPSACADQRVEVVIEQRESADERVALRYSTWTEGLGWCVQKTIRLDGDQLDDLHRALTVARHRVRRQRAVAGQPFTETAQVIQLPALA